VYPLHHKLNNKIITAKGKIGDLAKLHAVKFQVASA
jgi:hypothetical protein